MGITKQEVEIQNVALFTGEQNEEWFLKINPKHQVPVLQLDDGSNLTESDVIAKYLCKLAGGNWLYPCDSLKQARIDEAMVDVASLQWLYFPMTVIFNKTCETAFKDVEKSMENLVNLRFAKGNTFLVDDTMTMADILLALFITMCTVIGQYPIDEKYPALSKGLKEIEKMDEWKTVNTKMMTIIAEMAKKKKEAENKIK